MNVKTNQNYLFYDFETTNLNPNLAMPLELSFIVSNDNLKTFKSCKLNIIFDKLFSECSQSEQNALIFNKIYNQDDLNIHNSKSKPLLVALSSFVNFVETYFNGEDFYLIGYNNLKYDNVILNRLLNIYLPSKSYYILQNSYDVFKFIVDSKTYDISSDIYTKYFQTINKKLTTMYFHTFKTIFNAHDSLEDTKATLRLFIFYKKNLTNILFNEMDNCVSVFNFSENLIIDKKTVGFKSANVI